MDTLTVGEVHYENMVCSSLLGWAPIEPFGPFLVEQSGVFFSALEDLSWFVRLLLNKIYLPFFIYASNMALSNQDLDIRVEIETEISKSAPLGDLSTQRKGSKERPGKGSHEYEEINRTRLTQFFFSWFRPRAPIALIKTLETKMKYSEVQKIFI